MLQSAPAAQCCCSILLPLATDGAEEIPRYFTVTLSAAERKVRTVDAAYALRILMELQKLFIARMDHTFCNAAACGTLSD